MENVNKVATEKIRYDEGRELPKGFSSWEEVAEDGFSPVSSKGAETLLEALKREEKT